MQGRVTSQGRYARRVSPLLRSAMQPRSGRPDPRHRSGSAPAGGAHGAINARVPESAPVSAAGAGRRAACKRPGPWVAGRRCHPERCIVTGMQRSSWESIEPMAPTPINRAEITASPHWQRHRASREGRQRPAAGATPRRGQLPVRIAPVRDFRSFVLTDRAAHRTGKIPSSARAKTPMATRPVFYIMYIMRSYGRFRGVVIAAASSWLSAPILRSRTSHRVSPHLVDQTGQLELGTGFSRLPRVFEDCRAPGTVTNP